MTTAKPPRRKKPAYWREATEYLCARDEVLAELIAKYSGETLTSRGSAFYSLARAIVGQQISVKAADSIWRRVEMALEQDVTPASMTRVPSELLRAAGLSAQKVEYLRSLSQYFTAHPKLVWGRRSDEVIIKDLQKIKGIGRWSAEMFLIFHLLRADVFPIADIGLRKALEKHYSPQGTPLTLKEMIAHGDRWRPYRTVATWYLWRSLDPLPVEY